MLSDVKGTLLIRPFSVCHFLYALARCQPPTLKAAYTGNSAEGSVLLVQLFLKSAKKFNDDRYGSAKSSGLRQLKDTFKSSVPDDYYEVSSGTMHCCRHMNMMGVQGMQTECICILDCCLHCVLAHAALLRNILPVHQLLPGCTPVAFTCLRAAFQHLQMSTSYQLICDIAV